MVRRFRTSHAYSILAFASTFSYEEIYHLRVKVLWLFGKNAKITERPPELSVYFNERFFSREDICFFSLQILQRADSPAKFSPNSTSEFSARFEKAIISNAFPHNDQESQKRCVERWVFPASNPFWRPVAVFPSNSAPLFKLPKHRSSKRYVLSWAIFTPGGERFWKF